MTREEEIIADYEAALNCKLSNDDKEFILNVLQWADEHPKNLWISVEERLPEEFEMVFVHMQGGAFDCAIYTNGVFEHDLQVKFGFKDSGYSIISWHQKFKSNITHWMPIPQIEKGE